MIFELDCAKYFFTEEEKNEYEKMGFSFVPNDAIRPEFKYRKNDKELPKIIFNDIIALKKWVDLYPKCPLIISFDPNIIEIYDDYRE